jgi:hypothetical protein
MESSESKMRASTAPPAALGDAHTLITLSRVLRKGVSQGMECSNCLACQGGCCF